jgi:hypothetical protein
MRPVVQSFVNYLRLIDPDARGDAHQYRMRLSAMNADSIRVSVDGHIPFRAAITIRSDIL